MPGSIWYFCLSIRNKLTLNDRVKITNNGRLKITRNIHGTGNHIIAEEGARILNAYIKINGNNNRIIFEENVHVGEHCSFWMEGNNICIRIGKGTTFTTKVHFCAQEDNTRIDVGEDCMFSNRIIVRTSDSHPIYQNNVRINPPKNVKIGNHVWIAPNSKIFKGSDIGDNSIIGSDTLINKQYPGNCLIVGHPGKIVKTDLSWTREKLF